MFLRCLAIAFAAVAVSLAAPSVSLAQGDVEALGRALGGARPPAVYYEILRRDPTAFQFSRDNGWIRRAEQVVALRNAARAAAAGQAMFAPMADFNDNGVMRGDLNVPAFLILYSNTDSTSLVANVPRQALEDRLYGTHAAPPYSIHNYYREISNDSLRVNGTVLEWTRVSQPDTYYEAGNNGLSSQAQFSNMVTELVQAHDDTVNFGQFDNDGPDGIPNSGDDDGYVDAVVLMHPEVDGACVNINPASADNIWAHRWYLYTSVVTDDLSNAPGVSHILLRDYIIQGGQGGDAGCDDNEPQAMGVVAHETGHIFGLPDLYDWIEGGQGIGHWGLMGSGNWRRAFSPAHMEAWSRAQLGWVTEVLITTDTALEISPIEVSDTAYVLPVSNSDEYFLVENRQPIGSDAQMHGPGLLIWHVDSSLVNARWPINTVNSAFPYGVALEQADGLTELQDEDGNRGDAGDPFPGSTGNHFFGVNTSPSSTRHNDEPSLVSVDSIDYVGGTQTIRALVRFREYTVVMASDTMATFRLDGNPYNFFSELLDGGVTHQLEMDAEQVADNGRTRYTWLSWSNGQPRSHTFTASSAGDTIIANVASEYVLRVDVLGPGGSVTATPVTDIVNGELLTEGTVVTLEASVDQAGHIFEGWSGDSTGSATTFVVTMGRPYDLTATFAALLVIADTDPDTAVMGAAYQHQLQLSGGIDPWVWSVSSGALPRGLTLSAAGELSGVSEETGTFPFTAQVVSGSQTEQHTFQLEVAAPALVTSDVVAHVTGTATPLSAEEIHYLDLLGNSNGEADVGDFFAWVDATGVMPSGEALAAVMLGREGRP